MHRPPNLRRVLIIMPKLLGDAVLATPLITAVKAYAPDCAIDILAAQNTAGIFDGHPRIDHVFILADHWRRKGLWRTLRPRLTLLRALSRRRYDLLLQSPHTTDGSWGPLLIHLLRIPHAVGAHPTTHGSPLKRFVWKRTFTQTLPRPHACAGTRHTAELHLDLLRRLGIFPRPVERAATLAPGPTAEADVAALLRDLDLKNKDFLLFAPTAGTAGKSLPVDVARALLERLVAQKERIVVTAAPAQRERDYAQRITAGLSGVYNLAGTLTLAQVAELCNRAECFIGADSGTMHVAAAMGTPVVACFGPGDQEAFAPWQTEMRIVALPWKCRPCYADGCGGGGVADCLNALSPDLVMTALADIRTTSLSRLGLLRDSTGLHVASSAESNTPIVSPDPTVHPK